MLLYCSRFWHYPRSPTQVHRWILMWSSTNDTMRGLSTVTTLPFDNRVISYDLSNSVYIYGHLISTELFINFIMTISLHDHHEIHSITDKHEHARDFLCHRGILTKYLQLNLDYSIITPKKRTMFKISDSFWSVSTIDTT